MEGAVQEAKLGWQFKAQEKERWKSPCFVIGLPLNSTEKPLKHLIYREAPKTGYMNYELLGQPSLRTIWSGQRPATSFMWAVAKYLRT